MSVRSLATATLAAAALLLSCARAQPRVTPTAGAMPPAPPTQTTGGAGCKQVRIIDTVVTDASFSDGVDFPRTQICAGDTIVWRITNNTGGSGDPSKPAEEINVKVHKFEDRGAHDGKNLKWHSDNDIDIEPGYTRVIVATFPRGEYPSGHSDTILVEYWTKLKGKTTGRQKEKDPDLEVDPPPQ